VITYTADLSLIPYETAWEQQTRLVAARVEGRLDRNLVLLLEHPPVLTMGRRGGCANLAVSEQYLEQIGVRLLTVERGGDITYHGPGQLVCYPIVKLADLQLGIVEFVDRLEELMIRTAADWGIEAGRNPLNHGVWVGNDKLGSIGIAVRRGITFHGLALNVAPDMRHFDWITPCGLPGVKMTMMAAHAERALPMPEVKNSLKRHWEMLFSVTLQELSTEAVANYAAA
jgi:lipoate-protein ligase B